VTGAASLILFVEFPVQPIVLAAILIVRAGLQRDIPKGMGQMSRSLPAQAVGGAMGVRSEASQNAATNEAFPRYVDYRYHCRRLPMRTLSLATALSVATAVTLAHVPAQAAPMTPLSVAAKPAAGQSDAVQVQWRGWGGWGGRWGGGWGWGVGALAAGALVGAAIANSSPYYGGYGGYYPGYAYGGYGAGYGYTGYGYDDDYYSTAYYPAYSTGYYPAYSYGYSRPYGAYAGYRPYWGNSYGMYMGGGAVHRGGAAVHRVRHYR